MSHGVRVVPNTEIQPGQLILRVYGDPSRQLDDGNVGEDESHGDLPLSLVTGVEPLDEEFLVVSLACGFEMPLPLNGRAEVVSR